MSNYSYWPFFTFRFYIFHFSMTTLLKLGVYDQHCRYSSVMHCTYISVTNNSEGFKDSFNTTAVVVPVVLLLLLIPVVVIALLFYRRYVPQDNRIFSDWELVEAFRGSNVVWYIFAFFSCSRSFHVE